jgi:hypothetical protein
MRIENKIGVIGFLAIAALVVFYIAAYQRNQKQLQRFVPVNSNSAILQNLNGATATKEGVLDLVTIGYHNSKSDCWLLIENQIYDVSQYLQLHPGGEAIVVPFCGKDATKAFQTKAGAGAHSSTAYQELVAYLIGSVCAATTTTTLQQVQNNTQIPTPPKRG